MSERIYSEPEKYGKTIKYLNILAERGGLSVGPRVINQWTNLFVTMKHVDDYLDNTLDPLCKQQRIDDLFTFIDHKTHFYGDNPSLIESALTLRTHLDSRPLEDQESFSRNLKTIFRMDNVIKNTTDTQTLAFATRLEGQATSRLLFAFVDNNVKQTPEFVRFAKMFKKLCRTSNLFDTFLDWNGDWQRQQIAIKPSVLGRAQFIINTSTDMIDVAQNLTFGQVKMVGIIASKFARQSLK